jgi:hypothetical protein
MYLVHRHFNAFEDSSGSTASGLVQKGSRDHHLNYNTAEELRDCELEF